MKTHLKYTICLESIYSYPTNVSTLDEIGHEDGA